MIRGTTPTIIYRFNIVPVESISIAYLSLRQGSVYIEKDITAAVVDVDNKTISWKLNQEETLQLNALNPVELQIRYKLEDGTVGGSKVTQIDVDRILKGGEI